MDALHIRADFMQHGAVQALKKAVCHAIKLCT